MGTPRAVKQRMYYSLKGKPQPIYETDKDGNIIYLIIGGEQVPKETGETTSGYGKPVEFFNSIGGQLSQADVEAFGIQDTTVATMTYKRDQYPFQVGTLIWKNTPVGYTDNGDIDIDTADYKVIGIETTGKKYWRAIIKANVRDEKD